MKNKSRNQILIIALLAFIIIVFAIFKILKETSYNYSFMHLQDTLTNVKALRHFVSTNQKQEVYRLQDKKIISKEYFQPELLSSSFSAKMVNRYYNDIRKENGLEPILIRFASNNPRNPLNKANKNESEILEKFSNKEIKEFKEIRYNEEGKKVMYYAIPTRSLEPKCMRCHSTPDKAPKQLVDIYGDKNGFHEEVGSIRALISTEYPLTSSDSFVYKSTFSLSVLTLLILSIFVYFYIKFSNKILMKNEELENLNKNLESRVEKETQSLRQSNTELKLFKKIIDSIEVGVTIADYIKEENACRVVYINKTFEKMTGYNKNEIIGQNLKFLQNNDTEQDAVNIMKQTIKNKSSCGVEIRNYRKDGSLFNNFVSLSPIFDEEGRLINYIGIHHDITESKNNETKLQQQAKLASLGEMIANIAHQWRQPLSVISTSATGMHMKHELGMLKEQEMVKAFEDINTNVQYLSKTIDDFRNYIKGDSKLVDFNLTADTKTFLNLIDTSIKKYEIQIILDLEEDIRIKGYPNELNQCFINIFNNAKDVVSANEPDNRLIFISQYIRDEKVCIEFKDNGGGIPKDVINKIFEPYFTTKHKSQGTGLGLSMSYSLITNSMNGTLECENTTFTFNEKKHKGALFRIVLPLNFQDTFS